MHFSMRQTLAEIKPEIKYYMRPRILISCEKSGKIRDAFINRGFDAVSCDLEASDSGRGTHIQADVLSLIGEEWDLVIAHPPCTYLCNSGVRWLKTDPSRWAKMVSGAYFFAAHYGFKTPRLCIENPIPHKYALEIIGRKYNQIIQPWQYGHGETKATCFWLKGLPPLQPENIVPGRVGRIHRLPPGPNRSEIRSSTYQGVADAIANQWGAVLEESGFTSANRCSMPAGVE
jgi:hypothetical protein